MSHISFEATDKVVLPGLLYEPDNGSRQVAVYLHGMGDSGVFYKSSVLNELAAKLTDKHIALLAFNNRGAHDKKTLKVADPGLPETERYLQAGTHYELIADCVKDIDGAVQFLQERQFATFYLLGHSTGANKICVYNDLASNNQFSKYVLSGPGDDCGLWYQSLGAERFNAALTAAQQLVANGRPLTVMPESSGLAPFSAQSAADMLNPDGHYNTFPYYEVTTKRLGTKALFKEYAAITKPILVIIGSQDDSVSSAGSTEQAIKILKAQSAITSEDRSEYVIIDGAEHSFGGYESRYAAEVASWLGQ